MPFAAVVEPTAFEHIKFYAELVAALFAVVYGFIVMAEKAAMALKKLRRIGVKDGGKIKAGARKPEYQPPRLLVLAVLSLFFSPYFIACIAGYYRETDTATYWVCAQIGVIVLLGILSRKPPAWFDVGFVVLLIFLVGALQAYSQFMEGLELQFYHDRSLLAQMRLELHLKTAPLKLELGEEKVERAKANVEQANSRLEQIKMNESLLLLIKQMLNAAPPTNGVTHESTEKRK